MATRHYARLPRAQRELAEKLHDLLMSVEPDYQVGPAWSGIGYKIGKNYSCLVVPGKDHVKLMIYRGTELDDPRGVLQGAGQNTRHIRYTSAAEVKPTVLNKLLRQQLALFAAGTRDRAAARPRPRRTLPAFIRGQLDARGLLDAYRARPPYQRTDYVTWITEAKRDATRDRRLEQMLHELEAGDRYMKQPWPAGDRRR